MAHHPANHPQAAWRCAHNDVKAFSDELLVDAMKAGEVSALSELYDRHSPTVYCLCLKLTSDQPGAEALLEEIFYKLWHVRNRFCCPKEGVRRCLLAFAVWEASPRSQSFETGNEDHPISVATFLVSKATFPRVETGPTLPFIGGIL